MECKVRGAECYGKTVGMEVRENVTDWDSEGHRRSPLWLSLFSTKMQQKHLLPGVAENIIGDNVCEILRTHRQSPANAILI